MSGTCQDEIRKEMSKYGEKFEGKKNILPKGLYSGKVLILCSSTSQRDPGKHATFYRGIYSFI